MQDFDAAATRHYKDAALLHTASRQANANHLAGYATECALKAVLVRFLGAQAPQLKKPFTQVGSAPKKEYGHLPDLWNEVAMALSGRVTALAGLMSSSPFATWSIHDRYDDGIGLTQQTVDERMRFARAILNHLQMSKILGALQ